ncbi:MAG: GyrI-like domain-containing protein [Bacteroidia bacterium]|jgi:AraC family transcriptional regulator
MISALNNLQPEIKNFPQKLLIGKKVIMSLASDKTQELWRSFMTGKSRILNSVGTDLYALRTYPSGYWKNFGFGNSFEKWALTEVSDHDTVPENVEKFVLPSGLYAVFHYKGSNTDPAIFRYIYQTWLPSSNYDLDDRPHFEILGAKYKNGDPESEEEIFIPIVKK